MTTAVPWAGVEDRLQVREELEVSSSVALNCVVLQVEALSSATLRESGPEPWVITGDCLLSAMIETAKASRLPKLVKSVFPKVAV